MLTHEQELAFCRARREAIALNYQNLNPEQRKAVLCTEGPPAAAGRGWLGQDYGAPSTG